MPDSSNKPVRRFETASLRDLPDPADDAVGRAILESSPEAVEVLDAEGRVMRVNETGRRLFELDDDRAVLGRAWGELWPAPARRLVEGALEEARRGGVARFEEARPTAIGTPRGWQVRVAPVRDETGAIVQLVAISRDVTTRADGLSRNEAEAAPARIASLFTALIEQAPGGVYVVDGGFRLTHMNAHGRQTFASVRPLIGRDFQEVLEIVWGPALALRLAVVFRRTLETGERFASPLFHERRHDLGVHQDYEWETQRITLPDGQHGVVCYFNDVTDRARAAAALQESEASFRGFFENAAVGAVQLDMSGRFIRVNDRYCDMTGYTRAELLDGLDPLALDHPDDVVADRARLAGFLRGELPRFDVEKRYVRKDGSTLQVHVTSTLVRDEAGRALYTAGLVEDITARKALEQELRDADRRKDEFLATLAHELRNPLAAVRTAAALVKRRAGPGLTSTADVIDRQVRQLARLIDDLMDVSRINLGRVELRRERLALSTVLQLALETGQPLIEGAGHELTVDQPLDPIEIDGDATRLGQVFLNLLHNASKYTDRGGRIRLRAARVGAEAVVSVSDTGIGFPISAQPRLFDMFSQVDSALDRSHGGLGIGLFLVRRLVELHGGRVEARSEGPGRGSEFVVRLPLAPDRARPAPEPAGASGRVRPDGLRLLVVDDNVDLAETLGELLRDLGHEVRTVNDGRAAVEAAAAFLPRVVLLDLGLPGMNGYDACRAIRSAPWGRDVCVVALTGWGSAADRRKAREAGFDRHLVKPVDPDALLAILGALPVVR